MNSWQLAQQIKFELQTVKWPDGAAEVVFGTKAVFVVAGDPSDDALPPGFPFALITIADSTDDDDDPDLIDQSFDVATVVSVAGDPMGEFAVIGGSRTAGGTSQGAGTAEVAERVRAAVQKLTGFDGATLQLSGAGSQATLTLGKGRHLAFNQFRVRGLCTSQPHYAAPQHLTLVGDTMHWRGEQCSQRFDFLQYRIGYVTGDTPAATPAQTTIVATTTHNEVAMSFPTGRTYSVFADYQPRATGTVEASSRGDEVGAFVSL